MKRRIRISAAAALSALLAAACAPSARWVHPVLDERYWSFDVDACEGKAWSEVERDIAYRQPIIDAPGSWPDRSLAGDMARYSAQKEAQGLFSACMRSRGYRLVETREKN